MKGIVFFIIMLLTISVSDIPQPVVSEISVVDENFFKKELQESVLEFVNDLGLDPDSVYIPFQDEL